MQALLSQLQSLSTKPGAIRCPAKPGIYLFLDGKGEILYVGKAKNLKKRVNSYFASDVKLGPKTQALVSKVKKVKTVIAAGEIEALLLEANLIKKYKPKYNTRLTDGKNYPLIRITAKDNYPKILIARQAYDLRSIYFGPFPNSTAMALVLKTIRRIFPYQSAPNHARRICLYYHLGLCPCPPVFDSIEFRKEYRKNITHIINFLKGNAKKIIRDLTKERNLLSKNENFEKANLLQNKISAIELITGHFYKTEVDLDINPNFSEDLRKKEISDLKEVLNKNNVNIKTLGRIECFDISNISGTNATGSLVVFTNGEKDTNWYRRFKIKKNDGPNDSAMMEEVLLRRMKHNEWPMPDLIIVDGGKGQVSSALKAIQQFNNLPRRKAGLTIPVIGLAKREETIITSDFKEILLPKDSDALKLIMRIRDEAHRFAITYHRKLRSKNFLN